MKSKFQKMIILYAVTIAFIPIILSYGIFLEDKLTSIESKIKMELYDVSFQISQTPFIQEKLENKENDLIIQDYVMNIVDNLESIDIIVVADMTGEKYSHLDTNQIGQIFVNNDKVKVLEEGVGYYSLKKGSMGLTYRRFEPIYLDGEQVGFVMVGKYYEDIQVVTKEAKLMYLNLLIVSLAITIVFSYYFSRKIRRKILNMEPEEIAKLYKEKKIIINSISNGIIALNHENKVVEVNKAFYDLFDEFSIDLIINKLSPYIEKRENFSMKEMMILNRKLFVTLNVMYEGNNYEGAVITLIDNNKINQLAKEITGVDKLIDTLRANVHEFKNKLHVILGLIQLEEYDETKKFILEMQEIQENNSLKFRMINDYYVKAMLIGKENFAKEKKVKLTITEDSVLFQDHGPIDSQDIITILGNLIENAIESFEKINDNNCLVEIRMIENDEEIYIEVTDNGLPIPEALNIYNRGISSKTGHNRGNGLYLVKNKVELYNGIIKLEESKNKKTFTIRLYKGDSL